MSFFDCHLHVTFKHFLSDREKSLWDAMPGISILKSQSCLSQVREGDVGLAVCAVYPMERPFSAATLIQLFGPKLAPIDKDRLNDVINSPYNDLVWDELAMLDDVERKEELNFLRSMSDYDPVKFNMLFSVEGGHGLYGQGSLVDNIHALRTHSQYKFVSLNLAHLTQQENICCHAYGMKLLKKNDEFKPNGFGIGSDGMQIIRAAYDKAVSDKPLLIDMKHMSAFARQQFSQLPEVHGTPLIASHVGVTGISRHDIHDIIEGACVVDREFVEVKYKRVDGIDKTHFNPWSINLYDEDIKAIVESGGLIGLSLDQRIQGADNPRGEYWSLREFRHVVDTDTLQIKLKSFELPDEPAEEEDEGERLVLNVKKHLRHFANTVLHVVKIGGPDAWNCMCLGSDFDGMINPLNCCRSAADLPFFRNGLIETLPDMIKEAKKKDPALEFAEGDITNKVDKICFQNGFDFWTRVLG